MATKLGYWIVKHPRKNNLTSEAPNGLAAAFAKLKDSLLGASYSMLAYIGTQELHTYVGAKELDGITNHVILAKQIILSGKNDVNVVLIKFTEKNGAFTLYGIEPLFENAALLGGYNIDPKVGKDIPEDATNALKECLAGYLGNDVEPIALLATKVVKGTNYTFAVISTPVVPNAESKFQIVTVNSMLHTVDFEYTL